MSQFLKKFVTTLIGLFHLINVVLILCLIFYEFLRAFNSHIPAVDIDQDGHSTIPVILI